MKRLMRPSIHPSMYLCMHLSISVCIYLWISLCMHLSMNVSIYASISLCVYVCIYLCIYRSIHPIHPSIYLWIYLCMRLSIFVSMYASIYVCIYVSIDLSIQSIQSIYLSMQIFNIRPNCQHHIKLYWISQHFSTKLADKCTAKWVVKTVFFFLPSKNNSFSMCDHVVPQSCSDVAG